MKNEDNAKRHVMTVMIIINHASNLALISSMRFQWPAFVKELSKVMRLDFLVFLQPECLITDHGSPWFWLMAYSECLMVLLVLGSCFLLKNLASPVDWNVVQIGDEENYDGTLVKSVLNKDVPKIKFTKSGSTIVKHPERFRIAWKAPCALPFSRSRASISSPAAA